MRRFLFKSLLITLFAIITALFLNPQKYIYSCFLGLKLWATTVLPSILPFFFITMLICKLNLADNLVKKLSPVAKFLYNTDGYGAFVQFMSLISGYPVGAKLIAELKSQNAISKEEATKLSTFSSTSGPMFIVGSVGSIMFKSKKIGIVLLVSHFLSAILNGIIFRKYGNNGHIAPLIKNKKPENVLYECAFNSALSSIVVGTFISVFFVLSQILNDYKILMPLNFILSFILGDMKKATAFSSGLIECTSGCNMLSSLSGIMRIPLAEALISFGGISVIIQSTAFLKEAKVNIKIFLLSKIIQMITSFALCFVFCLIFKIS